MRGLIQKKFARQQKAKLDDREFCRICPTKSQADFQPKILWTNHFAESKVKITKLEAANCAA